MQRSTLVYLTTLSALLAACGGGKPDAAPAASAPAGAAQSDLTPFQLENGIGPITSPVELPAAVDHEKAEEGKKTFEGKCMACHKMTERYVGPALGGVVGRRTPAYVMNMILNPEEMYTKHPVARQLLAEHMTQMPNLGLTQEEARDVVEYLRTQSSATAGS
ncbi:MAG TPA: cytochrome c [Gemmatimonadales bacterium]|nr:cytochrome c [Gemmatimonadales bacterium]